MVWSPKDQSHLLKHTVMTCGEVLQMGQVRGCERADLSGCRK